MGKIKEAEQVLLQEEYLPAILSLVQDKGLSMALWRLPKDATTYVIISENVRQLSDKFTLEELPQGFIFAPFDKNKAALFLEGDLMFSFQEGQLKTPDSPTEESAVQLLANHVQKPVYTFTEKQKAPDSFQEKNKTRFIEVAEKSLKEIERGSFEKVVLSRIKKIPLPGLNIVTTFQKLCNTYPDALVSFVHIPETGTWMGASPEVLVQVEDKQIFKTVALAGTKPFRPGTSIKSIAWTQKEIEEQALVERYIISCFKRIRLREYDEHGPKTVIAGNLAHLRSDFIVDMKATNFPQLGSVMLQLLHPTSAVCGTPMDATFEFLKANEGYDREFYTGYLGPVNCNNNINLYVNLRCMQLVEDHAVLYAGAGVTGDSIAEDEWEEIETKLNTFSNVVS